MHVHNCRHCKMLCANVHPLCMWCRSNQRDRVETFVRRAESALIDAEEVSPVIVRQIDSTVARINRREAQARRRAKVSGLVQLWAARVLLSVAAAFVLIRLVISLGDLIVRAL
jgi:hypothetical protein